MADCIEVVNWFWKAYRLTLRQYFHGRKSRIGVLPFVCVAGVPIGVFVLCAICPYRSNTRGTYVLRLLSNTGLCQEPLNAGLCQEPAYLPR